MKNLNICIAGLGNVGSAVVSVIEKNSQYIKNKSNLTINIIGLSAKNKDKDRNFNVRDYKWIDNPMDLLNINDSKPDILIELIGYEKGLSYELVKTALNQKINVPDCFRLAFLLFQKKTNLSSGMLEGIGPESSDFFNFLKTSVSTACAIRFDSTSGDTFFTTSSVTLLIVAMKSLES